MAQYQETNNTTITATIWTKTIKTKEGKTFPKTLIKVLDTTFECIISKELMKSIQKQGLSMPLEIEFTENDYFIKNEKVILESTGEEFIRQKVVLTGCESVCETQFEKYTFEDAIRDRENRQ